MRYGSDFSFSQTATQLFQHHLVQVQSLAGNGTQQIKSLPATLMKQLCRLSPGRSISEQAPCSHAWEDAADGPRTGTPDLMWETRTKLLAPDVKETRLHQEQTTILERITGVTGDPPKWENKCGPLSQGLFLSLFFYRWSGLKIQAQLPKEIHQRPACSAHVALGKLKEASTTEPGRGCQQGAGRRVGWIQSGCGAREGLSSVAGPARSH